MTFYTPTKGERPTVFLCSPTNSTTFTTCCHVAICDDQALCPHCKREIDPPPSNNRFYATRSGRYDAPGFKWVSQEHSYDHS